MNIRKTTGSSAAAVAILLTAQLASAANPVFLSENAADCRAGVAKSYQKLMKTALKVLTGCHKSKDKGDEEFASIDCNDMAQADTKGKFAKARDKHMAANAKACEDANLSGGANVGKEWYISCPIPGCTNGTGPVANPMQTMSDVGACQACEVAFVAGQLTSATLGSPAQGSLDDGQKACRGAIEKSYPKYLSALLKNDTDCQAAADLQHLCYNGSYTATGCLADAQCPVGQMCYPPDGSYSSCENGADTKGKAQDALDKAEESLDGACTGVTFTGMGTCGTDLASLKTCNETEWGAFEDDSYAPVYEISYVNACPKSIRTTIYGGCSTEDTGGPACSGGVGAGNQSSTILSIGWTGFAHSIDIVDNYTLSGNVTCRGTVGSCGDCAVTGISQDNDQYAAFTRCKTDSSIPCTHPFSTDSVCMDTPGSEAISNDCGYALGPPLAVSTELTPTCSINFLRAQVTGTANIESGEGSLNVKLLTSVFSGENYSTQPCPLCRFDRIAKDGVKEGTCLGGSHDGDPCDVQGFDLTFARRDLDTLTSPEGPSLDCPPINGKGIGNLKIDLPLTTGQSSKFAQDPCEDPNQGMMCYCGVCQNGVGADACDNDQDCDLLDNGIDDDSDQCAAAAPGAKRLPNNCVGQACEAVGVNTDTGLCSVATDSDRYCDGAVRANGRGIIKCSADSGCDTYSATPGTCDGNDCGNCSISQTRSCFLDTIIVQGRPDTERPVLAGTFCLPPSPGSDAVNSVTGTPGPGFVRTDSLVEKRY